MIEVLVSSLRVFLVIFCAEASVRYWFWWQKAEKETGLLNILMLGIVFTMAGLSVRLCAAAIFAYERCFNESASISLAAIDIIILTGVAIHLIPCWRITHRYSATRIAVELLARGAVSAAAAFCFSWI